MLRSTQANINNSFFTHDGHAGLLTQSVVSARSKKNDKIESALNDNMSLYTHSSAVMVPKNHIGKCRQEKKITCEKSFDSDLDVSLSTSSSVAYAQEKLTRIHRPLNKMNKQLNKYDIFHNHSNHNSYTDLARNYSVGISAFHNTDRQKCHSNLYYNERKKYINNSNDSLNLNPLNELHQQININKNELFQPILRYYRSSNDAIDKNKYHVAGISQTTNALTSKQLKYTRKLKLHVKSSPPLSESFVYFDNEKNHTNSQTMKIGSTETVSNPNHLFYEQVKSKKGIPLIYYRNEERIKARASKPLIERQHSSYLIIPKQKNFTQKMTPSDTSQLTKVNHHHLFRQDKSFNSKKLPKPSDPNKLISTSLCHEDILDRSKQKRNFQELRRLNSMNQEPKSSKKDEYQTGMKHIVSTSKISQTHEILQNEVDNYYVIDSHHHRHYNEHVNDRDASRQKLIFNNISMHETDHRNKHDDSQNKKLKETSINYMLRQAEAVKNLTKNKNPLFDENIRSKSKRSVQSIIPSSQFPITKLIYMPKKNSQSGTNCQLHQTEKQTSGLLSNELHITCIKPRNRNNISRKTQSNGCRYNSKINLKTSQKIQNVAKAIFKTRSPTSCSAQSNLRNNQQQYIFSEFSCSPCSVLHELVDHKLINNCRTIINNDQYVRHGSYINTKDNRHNILTDDHYSQICSCHKHPLFFTSDSNKQTNHIVPTLRSELNISANVAKHENSSSSCLEHSCSKDRPYLSPEKMTLSTQEDDILATDESGDDWSDDGWSVDSAELIYVDARYVM